MSFAQDLLDDTREELVRADSKAALILAAAGVAVGALLAGLLSRDWEPFDLDNRVEWVWWVGAASAVYGLWRLARAVSPATKREGPPLGVLAYYGDVNRFKGTAKELKDALERSAERAEDRLVDQIRETSRIVGDKYASLRAGLVAFGAAGILCAAAALLDAVLG